MTILIADSLSPAAQERLRIAGHDLVSDGSLSGDALRDASAEHAPSVLVVRSTRVDAEALRASSALELVVRAGAGVDSIDVAEASRRGIFVANCPGKNAAAVAELTLGLILALDRRIPDNVAAAREGTWNKKEFASAPGLKGRTLGLVGLGAIGQAVAQRAQAFGMEVVAWSRSLDEERASELGVRHAPTPMDVARQADFVSVHVARTPETEHLIGPEVLAAMPDGAALINTSRAEVVDERAVAEAMDARGLRFATDVPAGEPSAKQGEFDHPLADHPRAYITHHIGASTSEASEAIGQEAARVILTYADTGQVPNVINLADQTPATHLLTVRHLDRVGVLARVLDALRKSEWNVQEMENLIFEGAEAACARIRVDATDDPDVVAAVEAIDDVLAATLLPL